MKYLISLFLVLFCKIAFSQLGYNIVYNYDTINRLEDGKQVGYWIQVDHWGWHMAGYHYQDQGWYINGLKDGSWVRYDSVKKVILLEMYYKLGRLEGVVNKYSSNGRLLMQVNFNNGDIDGKTRIFSNNGILLLVLDFIDITNYKILYNRKGSKMKIQELMKNIEILSFEAR